MNSSLRAIMAFGSCRRTTNGISGRDGSVVKTKPCEPTIRRNFDRLVPAQRRDPVRGGDFAIRRREDGVEERIAGEEDAAFWIVERGVPGTVAAR